MKKILAVLLAMYFFVPASFGQEEEIRPAAIGVSFILNDYLTANRIRTTSFSSVQSNKQWAKPKEMTPGLAISYFKGVRRHVDFAGTLAGSFEKAGMPNRTTSGEMFLLEADASLNLKMLSEKYWIQPYVTAGIGGSMYGAKYFGAFIPAGLGLKVNLFDDAHFYSMIQYRVPVTTETSDYRFQYSFGIAGRIGKKYTPAPPKALPPMPVDTDKDGILDGDDKCPTVPGVAKYEGCPVPDTDKDGINDEDDKCVNEPGVARYQGCPIPDTDGDGVNDEVDQCPRVVGTKENFGCPVINIKSYEIVFKSGSAVLLPEGTKTLDTVVAYLKRNESVNVNIAGHTDNTGTDKVNNPLSVKRAEATKKYIAAKGINPDRMATSGYGSTQPIADNKTAQGRKMNRRIEIKVKE